MSLARLGDAPVFGTYTIAAEDAEEVTGPVPEDYAEKAQMAFLGYATVAEALAEKFHMDIDLLAELNPGATLCAGRAGRRRGAGAGAERRGGGADRGGQGAAAGAGV